MELIRRLMLPGIVLVSCISQMPSSFAGISAETVGKLQEGVLAVCSARDAKLQALAEQYKANDAKELPRVFKITMPLGMVRRPMHFEMRRWGGKWLPGVAIMPTYNKSRNTVDSSGCELEGNSIKGRVEVTLISDGYVPPAGTSITLVYDIDATMQDGKITGTYHAHENRAMKSRAAENETKYRKTKEAGVKRGSVAAVLKMLPSFTIHQYEHDGDLTGNVEQITFKVEAPAKVKKRTLAGLDAAGLYAEAVAMEQDAEAAYRQIRATQYVRLTGAPYEAAVEMTPARPFWRPAFDAAAADAQVADIQERIGRMLAAIEASESWKPGEELCPVGEAVTDDPHFRGYFCPGPLDGAAGKPNIVPTVKQDGAESWHYVQNWRMLGRYNEDRHRRSLVPLPDIIPAEGAEYRPDREPVEPKLPGKRRGRRRSIAPKVKQEPKDWRVKWRDGGKQAMPFVDVGSVLGGGGYCLGYACTDVYSDTDQEVWAAVSPDDFCRVWVNDRLVFATPSELDEASVFKISFRKGLNRVMVRSSNDTHQWGMWLELCTSGRPRTAAEVAAARDMVSPPLETTGWFGPGHDGLWPDANPVPAWDVEQGINILWRLPFKNAMWWNNRSVSTPVIVGDKVFTQSDPHTLYCVDKLRGTILWERDSNVLEWIEDPEERKEALACYEREKSGKARMKTGAEIDALRKSLAEVSVLLQADQENEELRKRGEELEAKIEKLTKGERPLNRWTRKLKHAGFAYYGGGGWFGAYCGYTMATPVTDGKHIWVKHGTGVAACYDMEGNRKWMVPTRFVDQKTTAMPSPMLADGKLIVVGGIGRSGWNKDSGAIHYPVMPSTYKDDAAGGWMLALDAKTGELAWHAGPIRHAAYGICATPMPMKLINGKEEMWVLVTNKGQVIRVSDGKLLLNHMGVRAAFYGSPTIYGNTVYLARSGHVNAIELIMRDRDSVGARQLWTSPRGSNSSVILADGLLYGAPEATYGGSKAIGVTVKDPGTGRMLAYLDNAVIGGKGFGYPPIAVAGKYVFASAEYGISVVERSANPRVLARMDNKERMIGQPVFDGDRMYIRTYKSLMCIGKKGKEGEKFVTQTLGRTLMGMFPRKIYRVLTADAKARTDIEITAKMPVERIVTGTMPKRWIYTGPFRMKEGVDHLEPIGGCAKALPVEGTEFESGGKKYQFRKVDEKGVRGGIEVNAMRDGMGGSERYYYTVLDNRLGRKVLRMVLKGVATEGWIAGQRFKDGTIVRVEGAGMLPVLLKAAFPAGLPPFRKRGKMMFYCEEVDDPSGNYRKQIALLKKNEDALRRVIDLMPGSVLATRAQYLLGFVEVEKGKSGKSE